MRNTVILEKTDNGAYSAYLPGLTGCVSTGDSISKLTGMNQSLISKYVSGIKTPSSKQTKKIERALHNPGQELLEIER